MAPQTPHNKTNPTSQAPTGRTPLDQRHYSLLNWRSDVVVIATDTATLVQHARYNDSGSPQTKHPRIPAGPTQQPANADGIVNTTDTNTILSAIGGIYDAHYDLNLDGPNETRANTADHTIANNNLGDTLGHNALSLNPSTDTRGGHRLGYTGHTHADFNNALIVMRNRWYSGDLGRFMSRDPMGFVDGKNVYAYARGNGVSGRDPMGLFKMPNHPKFGIGSTTCVAGIPGQPNECSGPSLGGGGNHRPPGQGNNPGVPGTPGNESFTYRECEDYDCPNGFEPDPSYDGPKPNGCGDTWLLKWVIFVISGGYQETFRPCCDDHDRCYGTCGSDKNECDTRFCICMQRQCDLLYCDGLLSLPRCINCKMKADDFCFAVRDGGKKAFCRAQGRACQCRSTEPFPPFQPFFPV